MTPQLAVHTDTVQRLCKKFFRTRNFKDRDKAVKAWDALRVILHLEDRVAGDPRKLWAAVIREAVEDYRHGKLTWGYFNTLDFQHVCKLAGLDPVTVRADIRRNVIPHERHRRKITALAPVIVCLLFSCLCLAQSAPPDNPKPQTAAKVLTLADWTAVAWDMALSVTRVNAAHSCHETDPLYGRYPGTARYVVEMSVLTAGEEFGAHLLRKHGHPKWADAVLLGDALDHAEGIRQTYSNCRAVPR